MADLSRMMHDQSVFHKDLYFCHFYIHVDDTQRIPEKWAKRVIVIDLHRLSRHRATAIWWQVKDLAQLLYSSEIPGVAAARPADVLEGLRGRQQAMFVGPSNPLEVAPIPAAQPKAQT